MRFGEYGRIERDISAAEGGTIWHRWRYGRRLVCDTEITTPNGNFRHGKIEKLILASGGKLTERELQYRLQCGRAYPNESQIRTACSAFKTWSDLRAAGFPPFEAQEDELPYNPLSTPEIVKQHQTGTEREGEDERHGGGLFPRTEYEEGAIIPRDTFPDSAPLHELDRWAAQELELAARFSAKADKVRRYVDSLIKAANGDLNMSLGEAERLLHGND